MIQPVQIQPTYRLQRLTISNVEQPINQTTQCNHFPIQRSSLNFKGHEAKVESYLLSTEPLHASSENHHRKNADQNAHLLRGKICHSRRASMDVRKRSWNLRSENLCTDALKHGKTYRRSETKEGHWTQQNVLLTNETCQRDNSLRLRIT